MRNFALKIVCKTVCEFGHIQTIKQNIFSGTKVDALKFQPKHPNKEIEKSENTVNPKCKSDIVKEYKCKTGRLIQKENN